MWTLFIVVGQPFVSLFTHVIESVKDVHFENGLAVGAVETLTKRFCCEAGLDELSITPHGCATRMLIEDCGQTMI